MNRIQHSLPYAAIFFAAIGIWIVLWASGALSGVEQEAMRWRYAVRGELPSEAPIVFVDLDARTVAKIGDKPWDRLNFAQAIHALVGPGNARALGVDIIFSGFGSGSLLDVQRAKKGDLALGRQIQAYADKVVLAAAYTGTTSVETALPLRRDGYDDPARIPFPEAPTFPILTPDFGRLGLANVDEELNRGEVPHVLVAVVDVAGEAFARHLVAGQLRYFTGLMDQPRVVEADGALRLVDADGFAAPTVPIRSKRRLFTLGLAVFLAAHGLDANHVEWTDDALLIRDSEGALFRRVPLVGGQSVEVNWFQGWDSDIPVEHVSLADVLEQAHALARAHKEGNAGEVAAIESWFRRFQDKVVFIGPVDATLKDIAPTPYDRIPVPKVGVHANLYRTLQESAHIRRAGLAQTVAVIFLLAAAVSGAALWGGAGRWFTRTGSLALLLLYPVAVFALFQTAHFVLPLVAPAGAAICAALGLTLFKLGSEEWQRRRIKSLFGAYLSPELVDEMVETGRDPELGGTEAEVTALFSDIQGFSSLAERLSPGELITLMNEYLGAMTEAQQAAGGTLDKYIGDAIVAMFGMPMPLPDHAARACVAALRMQERHDELRRSWARSGRWPPAVARMRTRIGINTGPAVIGNMGSRVRFNYTMMGDSVNLAARCESGAKLYGVYTMVTDATLDAALRSGAELFHRKLDHVIVKGRSGPVTLYELWDASVDPDEAQPCRDTYHTALEHYFARDWKAAAELFQRSAKHEPARHHAPTTPSAVLFARCQRFLKTGAPENWTGAYQMPLK